MSPIEPLRTDTSPKRVLLVGWDAADWQMIHPLIERGLMPTTASLIGTGAWGNLATTRPILSPMAAPNSWLATVYLALLGSSLTFTLYFWLLARRSAVAASLISYTVPICAVLVGWLAFAEPVTWRLISGGGVVLAGVAVTLWPRGGEPAAPPAPSAPQRDKIAALR